MHTKKLTKTFILSLLLGGAAIWLFVIFYRMCAWGCTESQENLARILVIVAAISAIISVVLLIISIYKFIKSPIEGNDNNKNT